MSVTTDSPVPEAEHASIVVHVLTADVVGVGVATRFSAL